MYILLMLQILSDADKPVQNGEAKQCVQYSVHDTHNITSYTRSCNFCELVSFLGLWVYYITEDGKEVASQATSQLYCLPFCTNWELLFCGNGRDLRDS